MANAKRSGNPARRAAADKPTSRKAILVSSNSPWSTTGYGQQTAQLTRRLSGDGHSVAIASNYGLEGVVQSWEGMKHFPRGFDIYSNDVIPAHMAAWSHEHPDLDPLLITLFDTWVFKGKQWDMVDRIASWVPVDHQPCPPDVLAWCRRSNVTPIAMSQFGQRMLLDAGVPCEYAPHAIDTSVFTPTDTITMRDGTVPVRQFMDVPSDAFVIGMNSANKGGQHGLNRKGFAEAFLAFGMWSQQRTDAVLYVHTESKGAMGGIDLLYLAKPAASPRTASASLTSTRTGSAYPMRSWLPSTRAWTCCSSLPSVRASASRPLRLRPLARPSRSRMRRPSLSCWATGG